MNRGIGNYQNNGGRDSQYSNNSTFENGESSCNRGCGSSNYKGDNNIGKGRVGNMIREMLFTCIFSKQSRVLKSLRLTQKKIVISFVQKNLL